VISFESVGKTYPDGTVAVQDVTLDVPTGRTTVLVGTSGSGKTTLMRMVNRMVAPTRGRVLIDGTDVAGLDPVRLRRSIGYVLQEGGLFPHRSVIDNIATVPLLEGTRRPQARAHAEELMDLVGLDRSLARRFPAQLSGGQRQRVGVARALASSPDVLLMDEPFGAVDPLVRADLQRQLIGVREDLGTTILFVTHDIDEAFLIGHQVAVVRTGGTIAQLGTPTDILARPADQFVSDFVGAAAPRRRLRVGPVRDDARVVLDGDGRPIGLLAR